MGKHQLLIAEEAGDLLDFVNETGVHMDVNYASLTAPELVQVDIYLGDELFDRVHVGPGSSHSWWAQAGGKFLDHNGLDPDQRLRVVTSGPCALRLDWI